MNYFGDFLDKQTKKEIERICRGAAERLSEEIRNTHPSYPSYQEYVRENYPTYEEYLQKRTEPNLNCPHVPLEKKQPKKHTKQEILSMIDIALDNKDEQWFQELTDELKGMN